ncbi:MAG: hypothetical protein IJV06_10300 [Bacteroidaceae bacterium]|nr:hypothetical protein [Bacteroidaceae bacterium]
MKPILLALMLLSATAACAQKSTGNGTVPKDVETRFFKANPKALAIYNELCQLFPMSYLVNEHSYKADYKIQHAFRSRSERDRVMPRLQQIEAEIFRLPHVRRMTDDQPERNIHILTMEMHGDLLRQRDYLSFQYDDEKVSFLYLASYKDYVGPTPTQHQDVADELERAFQTYTKRKGVRQEAVEYRGDKYRAYAVCGVNTNKYYAKGTRYVVPDCKADDFRRLSQLLKSHALKDDIKDLYCTVYGEYEQIALCCKLQNGAEACFGIALKGTDLYLVRTESRPGGEGLLPRAWAESDPVYRESLIKWNATEVPPPPHCIPAATGELS